MRRVLPLLLVVPLMLAGCGEKRNQNTYDASEVGISRAVEFGTVLNRREVDITGENTGNGTLLGGGLGAGAGSYVGQADGNIWATAGAAIAGAVAGHYAEQAISDRKGFEYVVQLQSGEAKTIVQEQAEGDVVFKPGDHVMVQYCDAGNHASKCREGKQYQRLLPIAKLPAYVKVKRKFVQTHETQGYEKDKAEKGGDADFELTPLGN